MSVGQVGYYIIEGWLKIKDSKGFDAKPPEKIHTCTGRDRARAMYSKYAFKAEDPTLIRVLYYYGDHDPRDLTEDFLKSFPRIQKRIKS